MSENLIGATTAIFPIRLSVAVASPVDVEWATRDGSAIAGSDYKAASGTVTFLPGETEKQIEVQVYGQAITPADDKVFFIRLNPPSNAVLVDAILTCTINIIDDQGIPSVAVVVAEGRRGPKGDPGLSAYDQAVLMGYTGTLTEWMDQIADASNAADRAEDHAISAAEDALKAQDAAKNAVFAGVIFPTTAEGVDPILGVQNGAYFNVRSPLSDHYIDEYQNINGVAVATGKSYPTSDHFQAISQHTALPFADGKIYTLNQRVALANGEIVQNTLPLNTNDPNIDMTGWLNIRDAVFIRDASGKSQQEVNNLQSVHNKSSATLTDYLTPNEIANSSTTDLTAKIQSIIDAGVVSRLRIPKGEFRLDGLLTINRDFLFDPDIDGWFNVENGGSFLFTGSATLLGKPTSNIAKHSKTINFADTSSINEYDLLCIYNPVDSSFSPRETFYRNGEFIKVASKTANSFSLFGKTFDSYLASEVDVYKINPITAGFTRFNIIDSDDGIADPIKFTFCENLDLSKYNNFGSKTSGIIVDRCYNTTMPDSMAKNNSDLSGLNYGIVVANSQLFRINGGNPLAARHCVTVGGYDQICCVPCREVYISNMSLKTSNTAGIGAADFHGNACDSHYENCIIDHGSFGGKNISIRNCTVFNRDIDGSCLIFQGLVGGEVNIENVTLRTSIASSSARSYLDITLLDDLKEDLVVNIRDLKIFGDVSSSSPMIAFKCAAGVVITKKITLNIEVDSYVTQNGAFLNIQGSAAQPILPNVEINMIRANSKTKGVYYVHPTTTATSASTKLNLPKQIGSQLITTAGEATGIKHGDLITLPYYYPVPAKVIPSVGSDATWVVDSTFNLKPVSVMYYGSRTTQVRFALVSGASLPASKTFEVSYEIGT